MAESPEERRLTVSIDVLTLLNENTKRTQEMFTEIKASISGLLSEFETNSRDVAQRQAEQDARLTRLESSIDLHKEVGHPDKFKFLTALEARVDALEISDQKLTAAIQGIGIDAASHRLQIATFFTVLVALVTIIVGFITIAGHVTLH
jgi:hypothetical protein